MQNGEKPADGRSKGGQNSGGNFKNDPARAAEAGRKGGQESGGNFKNDPARAAAAGKKGGQSSGGRRESRSGADKPARPAQGGEQVRRV